MIHGAIELLLVCIVLAALAALTPVLRKQAGGLSTAKAIAERRHRRQARRRARQSLKRKVFGTRQP
jgi:hypothetical protein